MWTVGIYIRTNHPCTLSNGERYSALEYDSPHPKIGFYILLALPDIFVVPNGSVGIRSTLGFSVDSSSFDADLVAPHAFAVPSALGVCG